MCENPKPRDGLGSVDLYSSRHAKLLSRFSCDNCMSTAGRPSLMAMSTFEPCYVPVSQTSVSACCLTVPEYLVYYYIKSGSLRVLRGNTGRSKSQMALVYPCGPGCPQCRPRMFRGVATAWSRACFSLARISVNA